MSDPFSSFRHAANAFANQANADRDRPSFAPPIDALPAPATRDGQREIAAATLAAALIAVEGRAAGIAEALALMSEVRSAMDR